jgi:acetyltransferase-like isoleucine patch superfamily enzyme
MRDALKSVVRGAAFLAVLPRILSFRVWSRFLGRDRALEGATQSLARVPGIRGQYLRRAFLAHAINGCHPTAAICWGTVFSKAGATIDENAYVGPGCHLGLVHVGRNVLLAAGVHVPSGMQTHGTGNVEAPIRDQAGQLALVTIGEGSWVGSAAVVMADIGRDSVIGAGSVVTKPIPDRVIAAGVPARVIRGR